MRHIGLYIDLSNLYYSTIRRFKSKVDYGVMHEYVSDLGNLLHAKAYGAKIGKQAEGFIHCLKKMGYEPRYKEAKEFRNGDRKADWDVGITVDILSDIETTEMNCVFLCTADGDYAPLVQHLLGKRLEVIVIGCGISQELSVATECIELSTYFFEKNRETA